MTTFRCSICALLSALCIFVLSTRAVAQADDQAAINWLRRNAIPIQTVEAGHGFADLQPLDKIVGDARIVALGEATHGTREFFQLKHRLIEYLATQKGFTIFSIEANMPEAYRLNDYVLRGVGDPKRLLKGMYFWTWNTQEVLDMILWMREFNQSGKGRIEFTGFDMQNATVPIDTVRKFILHRDPAYFSATLEPVYTEVQHLQPAGSSFAVATATFPAQPAAAGKRVTLSGYFRTENLSNGWAGLWLRADGPQNAVLAIKNMQDHGVIGTTPWTRYEISIDVPFTAESILFDALNTGSGTAWVDSLAITIDGAPYTDESRFDLGFESTTPRGFYTGGDGYEVALDSTVAYAGKQSLRMTRTLSAPTSLLPKAPVLEAQAKKCASVVDYLIANRDSYLKSGLPAHDVDWVIQNARLVEQFVELQAGTKTRDESMADNIKWIADENPGAKIVVWAHNGHVSNTGYGTTAAMGSYLRKMFGSELVNFGFAFNQGSFQAVEPGKGLHSFTVALASATDGTLDLALAKTGIPIFAVDLRLLPTTGPVADWFHLPHSTRSIGAMYSEASARNHWNLSHTNQDFDVLLFVEKTTAAREN
jgi:erythromycin esterase-like protein